MKRTLEMNIREASEKGTVLVCMTQEQIDTITSEASRLGVLIEQPILLSDYHQAKLASTLI